MTAGNGWSDPVQRHQLKSLFLGGLAGRRSLVTLAFERCNLLLYKRQPRDLPRDLACKPWRQWTSISSDELIDLQSLVLTLHVDAANALTEQQALNAIDVSCPFTDQAVALAMRAPEILLVDIGSSGLPTRRGDHPGPTRSAPAATCRHRSDPSSPCVRAG
jgi:hypothetical protein